MISTDQRILIVFIGLIFSIILNLHNILKYHSFNVRVFKFIQILILFFPLIDLKLPPSEMNFKFFDFSIFAFSILNFKSLIYNIKKCNTNLVLFFLLLILSFALFSEFVFDSVLTVIRIGLACILFLYLKIAVNSGRDVYKFFLVPIVLWAILFFILQLIFGIQFSFYQNINEISLRDLRYTSFSQDPQKFAQLIFMLAIIFLSSIYQNVKMNFGYNWILIASCLLIGLTTGSRAPFLGFVISFFFMFITKINIKTFVTLTVIYFIFNFIYEFISDLQVFQRMNDLNSALDVRMQIFWVKGFMIFYDNLWIGVGSGNFLNYVTAYHNDFTYGENGGVVDQPESGLLLWLCEFGVFGTFILCLIIYKTLSKKVSLNNVKPFKLSIIVWLFGFITIYSLSDVKVLFLLLFSIAMVYSKNFNSTNMLKSKN